MNNQTDALREYLNFQTDCLDALRECLNIQTADRNTGQSNQLIAYEDHQIVIWVTRHVDIHKMKQTFYKAKQSV